ncbi:hypothetical protein H920_03558 [Fukomys damarensis]|uniref:Uncharacterized protein n=1 Tax=Fukomys damarensis TaxID=885580 RepID=A0A091EHT6_FUKDA|nr:hypothetical protein H920_03558 [Fukomys damarensis]
MTTFVSIWSQREARSEGSVRTAQRSRCQLSLWSTGGTGRDRAPQPQLPREGKKGPGQQSLPGRNCEASSGVPVARSAQARVPPSRRAAVHSIGQQRAAEASSWQAKPRPLAEAAGPGQVRQPRGEGGGASSLRLALDKEAR